MESEKRITLTGVLQEGVAIGIKNALSLMGAIALWLLTIWIPYINVGTTIAISSIPLALARGGVISPLFIFDAKYRKYMGEYFMLIGLSMLSIYPAMLFFVAPGIVIAIGWSLSVYIMLDRGVTPGEALVQSNKATYGYKWTIFGVQFIISLVPIVLMVLFTKMGVFGMFMIFIILIINMVVSIGCSTVIYRNLAYKRDLSSLTMDKPKNPLFD